MSDIGKKNVNVEKKVALITGITGQDGSYLSKLLINNNYTVIGLTRSYISANCEKLKYLEIYNKVTMLECNLEDISNIINIINEYSPDEIYHLASQSSVSLSFQQPIGTVKFNVISTLNILEAIKIVNKNIKFYHASSSEMFGRVNSLPVNEMKRFYPLSPYAISKASAHWITVNYRESYNIFACCGILFNHESYLRSTNFFVKKVIITAVNIKNGKDNFLRVGNIDIKRDFGYSPKYVEAMWQMLQKQIPDDYIICSGSSTSLREIIYYVFDKLNISRELVLQDEKLYRPTDIIDMYGDNTKAKTILNWEYNISIYKLLDLLIEEELKNYDKHR